MYHIIVSKILTPGLFTVLIMFMRVFAAHNLHKEANFYHFQILTSWVPVRSWMLERLKTSLPMHSHLRNTFADTPLPTTRPSRNHTHAQCAADRTVATTFMDLFSNLTGFDSYYVQYSRADKRKGRGLFMRTAYWAKDLTTKVKLSIWRPPAGTILLSLVDVDYYMPINSFLAYYRQPTILYTMQPEVACRETGEQTFTWKKDDGKHLLDSLVRGGASYCHEVWNYTHADNVTVYNKFFGIPVSATIFNVETRKVAEDRALVLLNPSVTFGLLGAWILAMLGQDALKRLQPITEDNEFIRLKVLTEQGMFISTGRTNRYACATVPASTDETFAAASHINATNLSPATVSMIHTENDEKKSRLLSSETYLLVEYHRTHGHEPTPVVIPINAAVKHYQFYVPDMHDPDAAETLTAFMSPMINGTYAPVKSRANAEAAIKGRVKDCRSTVTHTPKSVKYQREFLEKLIPDHEKNTLHPVDYDEVAARQSRPAQVILFAWAMMFWSGITWLPRKFWNFVKREAYSNANHPRIITIINPIDKVNYSRFTYAFTDNVMKSQKWYLFGMTPREVAEKLARLARLAIAFIVCSDFSRFDGHVSPLLRDLEIAAYLRAFHESYHSEILELMRTQYGKIASLGFGTRYETKFARSSGSPETSAGASLDNAFIHFCAFREMGFNPDEAYEKLGLYGGDDGATSDIDVNLLIRSAKMCGQVLTKDVFKRGDPDVYLLGRIYTVRVWGGDPDSTFDPYRQMSKLHTTKNLQGVTALQKLGEKLTSLFFTDRNTAYIGAYLREFHKLSGTLESLEANVTRDRFRLRSWNSLVPVTDQYPNDVTDETDDIWNRSIPDWDGELFMRHLAECKKPEDFLTFPLCASAKPNKLKENTVVNGHIEHKNDDRDQPNFDPSAPELEPEPAQENAPGPFTPIAVYGNTLARMSTEDRQRHLDSGNAIFYLHGATPSQYPLDQVPQGCSVHKDVKNWKLKERPEYQRHNLHGDKVVILTNSKRVRGGIIAYKSSDKVNKNGKAKINGEAKGQKLNPTPKTTIPQKTEQPKRHPRQKTPKENKTKNKQIPKRAQSKTVSATSPKAPSAKGTPPSTDRKAPSPKITHWKPPLSKGPRLEIQTDIVKDRKKTEAQKTTTRFVPPSKRKERKHKMKPAMVSFKFSEIPIIDEISPFSHIERREMNGSPLFGKQDALAWFENETLDKRPTEIIRELDQKDPFVEAKSLSSNDFDSVRGPPPSPDYCPVQADIDWATVKMSSFSIQNSSKPKKKGFLSKFFNGGSTTARYHPLTEGDEDAGETDSLV